MEEKKNYCEYNSKCKFCNMKFNDIFLSYIRCMNVEMGSDNYFICRNDKAREAAIEKHRKTEDKKESYTWLEQQKQISSLQCDMQSLKTDLDSVKNEFKHYKNFAKKDINLQMEINSQLQIKYNSLTSKLESMDEIMSDVIKKAETVAYREKFEISKKQLEEIFMKIHRKDQYGATPQ